MTKQALTSSLIMTADTLAWLKVRCDVPAKSSDSSKQLRWKAAQRAIYLDAKSMYERSITGSNATQHSAAKMGIQVRSDD